MSNKEVNGQGENNPVLDFVSGKTETIAAKRLTKNIRSVHSLWLLAKMSNSVRSSE